MFTRIQPPQTSGSKASEHLHPSHFRLACWQNTTRSRECQQNKLYKSWNIHIQETLWCSWAYIQPRKASLKKKHPKRRRKRFWNHTLPSQSAKGAFLSIVSGLKKLFNSINWGKRTLKFIYLHFFFFFVEVAQQSAAQRSETTHNKYRQKFYAQARWDKPSRPFIFSYLLFQIVNSCASYYPSSCDYSPRLTRRRGEEKKKSQRPSLGFGVFLLSPHNWLSMCGEENLNYSRCEAMAPPMELEPMRMCLSFPLFQLGHAKKKKKKTLFYTSL